MADVGQAITCRVVMELFTGTEPGAPVAQATVVSTVPISATLAGDNQVPVWTAVLDPTYAWSISALSREIEYTGSTNWGDNNSFLQVGTVLPSGETASCFLGMDALGACRIGNSRFKRVYAIRENGKTIFRPRNSGLTLTMEQRNATAEGPETLCRVYGSFLAWPRLAGEQKRSNFPVFTR